MALYLPTHGEPRTLMPENGRRFTLKELQSLIDGSVQVLPIGRQIYVIDEEGKLKDKPLNRAATHRAHDFLFPGDFLAGHVLICEACELEP